MLLVKLLQRMACAVHTSLEESENATIICHFTFAVEENSVEENHIIAMSSCFEKLRFQNVIRPPENGKPAFSNSSGFEECFRKAPCLWRISVDVRLNCRNKARFFSDIVRTGASNFPPKSTLRVNMTNIDGLKLCFQICLRGDSTAREVNSLLKPKKYYRTLTGS